MANKEYGKFQSANDHLDDVEALNSISHWQGYLFFRSALDERLVLQVKGDFVRALVRQSGLCRAGRNQVSYPFFAEEGS